MPLSDNRLVYTALSMKTAMLLSVVIYLYSLSDLAEKLTGLSGLAEMLSSRCPERKEDVLEGTENDMQGKLAWGNKKGAKVKTFY